MIFRETYRRSAWMKLILVILFCAFASGAFGNRVSKTVGGVTTKYLVEDDVNPTGYPQVLEEIVSGAVQREYTYGLLRISQNQIIDGAWTPSYYGYDGFGNVRQLTNSAGAVTDTYEYDAWGNALVKTGTTSNSYLYRSEQYDSDLGLYYLRARYYNPATGRFLSRDPQDGVATDPKTLHKYLYAAGDPANGVDPKGLADEVEYKLIKLEIGAAALKALPIVANVICTELAVAAFAIDGLHYFNPKKYDGLPWPVKVPCALWGIWKGAYAGYVALVALF